MSAGSRIHSSAVIDPGAELASDVEVGPFAVIGAGVRIGAGSRIGPHTVIHGPTTIGEHNRIHAFASVGDDPQDLKYRGGPSRLEIGDRNTIREYVTLHRGTEGGGGVTRVGNDNLFMACSHVAHDSRVGNGVVMANAATLAGHVTVADNAIVGGLVAVHQFTRIGCLAMLGGGAMVNLDVPPFCMVQGDRAKLQGLNVVGLKRSGMSDEAVRGLRRAYRVLFQSGLRLQEAVAQLREEFADFAEVQTLADFVETSERGICRAARAAS